MRIALVAQSLDKRSGEGSGFVELAERLASRGHVVLLLAAQAGGVDLGAVAVRELPHPQPHARALAAFVQAAERQLRRERVELVCARGLCLASAQVVRLERPLGEDAGRVRGGLAGHLDRRALRAQSQLLASSDCRVLAPFECTRAQIEARLPALAKRLEVIPDGVDDRLYTTHNAGRRRAAVREALGIDEGRVVAIYIARAGRPASDLERCIDALRRLPELSLLVLDVPAEQMKAHRDRARRQGLADRLLLVPRTEQRAGYFAAADLYLEPGFEDGYPHNALNAASSGLPLVLGRSLVSEELVDDERQGLRLGPQPEQLQQALLRLVEHPPERLKMGRAAHQLSRDFAWDEVLERYERLFESLRGQPGSAG